MVFSYLPPTSPNSLASSLHSIYGVLLLIISVHDLILSSSAILDAPSAIKHEPALSSVLDGSSSLALRLACLGLGHGINLVIKVQKLRVRVKKTKATK